MFCARWSWIGKFLIVMFLLSSFRYSIPNFPYSISANVGTEELNSVVNRVLIGELLTVDLILNFLSYVEVMLICVWLFIPGHWCFRG